MSEESTDTEYRPSRSRHVDDRRRGSSGSRTRDSSSTDSYSSAHDGECEPCPSIAPSWRTVRDLEVRRPPVANPPVSLQTVRQCGHV